MHACALEGALLEAHVRQTGEEREVLGLVERERLRPHVAAGSFLVSLVERCGGFEAEDRPAFHSIVDELSEPALVSKAFRVPCGPAEREVTELSEASLSMPDGSPLVDLPRTVTEPTLLPPVVEGASVGAGPSGPSLSRPEMSRHVSTVGHWFGWHDDSERTKDRPGRWSRRDRASGEQSADGGVAGLVTPAVPEDDSEGSSMPEARRMTRAAREAAAAARGEGAASSPAPAPSAAELAALDLEA